MGTGFIIFVKYCRELKRATWLFLVPILTKKYTVFDNKRHMKRDLWYVIKNICLREGCNMKRYFEIGYENSKKEKKILL